MSALTILTKCPLANCPLANYPLANCPLTKCPLANCPDTVNLLQMTHKLMVRLRGEAGGKMLRHLWLNAPNTLRSLTVIRAGQNGGGGSLETLL